MDKSKKQEIIDACMAEFSKCGYEKANTNTICEHAGVSKGLIFHYFGSKKQLYVKVVEKCIEDTLEVLEAFNVDESEFIQAILSYFKIKWDFFTTHPLHYRLLMQAFFNTPDDVKDQLAKRYSELVTLGTVKTSELIDKLDLKDEVSKENVLELILSITGIIDKKYLKLIAKSNSLDNELYATIKNDYIELVKMVLYGILN